MASMQRRVVAGRVIEFPVPVVSASVSGAVFLARTAVARELIAAGGQSEVLAAGAEPVSLPGGRTPVTVIHVRYHDVPGNVLGGYHEVGLAFQVAVPGVGVVQHIHELPVDRDFTLAAGKELWGFPKWKGDMAGSAGGALDDALLGAVGSGGAGGMEFWLDTRVGVPLPGRHSLQMTCVQVLDGAPVVVQARARVAGGRVRPFGGARLTVASGCGSGAGSATGSGAGSGIGSGTGDGEADVARLARAVRELGLDRGRALATFSFERFEARFQAPEPLR